MSGDKKNDPAKKIEKDGKQKTAEQVTGKPNQSKDLLGAAVKTEFGHGIVSDIRSFETDVEICRITLDKSGNMYIPRTKAEKLERVPAPVKKRMPRPRDVKGGRIPNVMGHIRMYNPTKGWGFVVSTQYEGDIFLHSKHILGHPPPEYIGHFNSCAQGHSVKFDLDLHDDARPQALNVRMIGGALSSTKKDSSAIPSDVNPFTIQGGTGPKAPPTTIKAKSSVPVDYGNGPKGFKPAALDQDIPTLPLAQSLAGGTSTIAKAHPLHTGQLNDWIFGGGPPGETGVDWVCPNPSCNDVQFSRNLRCRVCGTPKPGGGRYDTVYSPPAAVAYPSPSANGPPRAYGYPPEAHPGVSSHHPLGSYSNPPPPAGPHHHGLPSDFPGQSVTPPSAPTVAAHIAQYYASQYQNNYPYMSAQSYPHPYSPVPSLYPTHDPREYNYNYQGGGDNFNYGSSANSPAAPPPPPPQPTQTENSISQTSAQQYLDRI